MTLKILVLNLGSTSTKVAYFENTEEVSNETLRHSTSQVCLPLLEQVPFRLKSIHGFLDENDIELKNIDIISARGGLLKPIDGGTYGVNKVMLDELTGFTNGEHASNLSAVIAHELGRNHDIQATITDPVVVDEMIDEGLIEEAKNLYNKNKNSIALNTAIGYKELFKFFKKEISKEDAIELIKRNSRRYAKRQYTWINNKMNAKWFNVNLINFDKTVKEVIDYLEKNC